MPELPDVEGFGRIVRTHALSSRVRAVRVLDSSVLHTAPESLQDRIIGRTLRDPSRYGKWLRVPTNGPGGFPLLLVHFGMTGSFEWTPADETDHRHDRVVFDFREGALRYRDMRKLTGIWLADGREDVHELLRELGPDAATITEQELRRRLTRRARRIKSALMDQKVLAGLGNLCVDEILWRARCDPAASTAELSPQRYAQLHARLRTVVRASTRAGKVPDYRSWLTGHRDERDGHCPRCGSQLSRDRIGGRSTMWCPQCQSQ